MRNTVMMLTYLTLCQQWVKALTVMCFTLARILSFLTIICQLGKVFMAIWKRYLSFFLRMILNFMLRYTYNPINTYCIWWTHGMHSRAHCAGAVAMHLYTLSKLSLLGDVKLIHKYERIPLLPSGKILKYYSKNNSHATMSNKVYKDN